MIEKVNHRHHLRIASVSVLSLALVACSPPSSSESESSSEGDIIIGSAMPLTGPYASDGVQMERALELAIEERNEDGGVLGRQVRLETCDVGALEVDTIQACAERLLGENPHAVITGYDDSGVNTLAFGPGEMPYLHGVAMLAAIEPVMEDPETYGNTFQYMPSDIDYGVDAAEHLPEIAGQMGIDTAANKTVAVVGADYSYNVVAATQFKKDMEAQGFEIVVDETTPFGVEEWGPIISKITAADPAIVSFWNLDPSDAARFIIQLRRAIQDDGLESAVYMQYTPAIPEFLELAGDSAEGLIWSTVIGVTDVAVPQEEIDDYEQRYSERFGNEPEGAYAYTVRDAFDLWAQSVEDAGCAECFDDVVQNIRDSEYSGFGGNYRFAPVDEGQYALPGPDAVPTVWSQVRNGEHVRIFPDNVAEADAQAPPWLP